MGLLKKIDKKLWNHKLYRLCVYIPRKGVQLCKKLKKTWNAYLLEKTAKFRLKYGGSAPLVSIVMPVYNAEKYIEQALDSLLEQSVKYIEIIAVDDGSTDGSLDILKRYAAKDQRISVYTQENQYAGAARNLGMSHAKGEYLLFLDSDDFFDKDLVKDTYYKAKKDQADIVLFGARHYNDQTGEYSSGNYLDLSYAPEKEPFCRKDCPDTIFQIGSDCPWTKLFKRTFIEETGLQFQKLYNANDIFFVLSAIAMADRIVTLEKPYINYRVGLQNNLQSSQKRCFLEAYYAWHDQLKKLGYLDSVRKSYANCILNGCTHNLRKITDLKLKRELFERLKNEAFPYLEITRKEEGYYYNKRNYRDMKRIFYVSFEQYLEAYAQSAENN